MNFRIGLFLTGIASLTGGAAFVACGGSSTSTADSGTPDSGPPHDSGKPDTGKPDSGKPDSGAPHDAGKDVATSQDAGSDVVTPAEAAAPTPTDADVTACNAAATATCGNYGRCNALGLSSAYGDAGSCIARTTANCEIGILAPGSGNKASGTAACAAAEANEPCGNYLNGVLPDASCGAGVGTTATGGGCSENAQCATSYCAIPLQSACGKCATPPVAGDSCADLAGCGAGLVCYKELCVAYTTTVNGACSLTQPCGAGLSCVIPREAGAGTCQTSGTVAGTACDPKLETAPGCSVAAGFYCVPANATANAKTCQPIQTATAGEPCGFVDDVTDNCTDLSVCYKGTGDAGRTCVARAADNAACNTVTGPACMAPARCLGTQLDGGASGTCTLRNDTACP